MVAGRETAVPVERPTDFFHPIIGVRALADAGPHLKQRKTATKLRIWNILLLAKDLSRHIAGVIWQRNGRGPSHALGGALMARVFSRPPRFVPTTSSDRPAAISQNRVTKPGPIRLKSREKNWILGLGRSKPADQATSVRKVNFWIDPPIKPEIPDVSRKNSQSPRILKIR